MKRRLWSSNACTSLRASYERSIWPGGRPNTLPAATRNYAGLSYKSSVPLDCGEVIRLDVTLPRGGAAELHLIAPSAPALNRLLIVHAGHSITYFDQGTKLFDVVRGALLRGYHVLGVPQPQTLFFPTSSFSLRNGGTWTVSSHDFSGLENDGQPPLVYFVEPTIQGINYARTLGFKSIDMTGISGGGLTTEKVCAVDPFIRIGVPACGSLPFTLCLAHGGPGDNGDWEQAEARSFWQILGDYTVSKQWLYKLGAKWPGRKIVKILGDADPVFPIATIPTQVAAFEADVRATVGTAAYSVYTESVSTHSYSDKAINDMFATMAAAA